MFEPSVGDLDLSKPAAINETKPFAWASPRSRVRGSMGLGPGVSTMVAVWLDSPGVAALSRMARVMTRAMSPIAAQSCNLDSSSPHPGGMLYYAGVECALNECMWGQVKQL